jgi:serine/threonine protein kinase
VRVFGEYRIEGTLGRGGMGVVYSARHMRLGHQVALKVLAGELSSSWEFVDRFRREGRMQALVDHPHTVTVYEAGESEHGLYLAMQLIPGPTLAQLIEERTLSAATALALLRQLADALDAVHVAGLVHRDVKPQNVLVGDDEDAYLGDFGLVRADGAATITAEGRLVGTIPYLAPELIRGEQASAASDRYAFAAMAFECLTGSVVFPRQSEAAMLAAHVGDRPPAISKRRHELPAALDRVFARALAKNPAKRFDSARSLVDAVTKVLEGAGLGALGPPPSAAALLDRTTAERQLPVQARAVPFNGRLAAWLVIAALAGAAMTLGVGSIVGGSRPVDREVELSVATRPHSIPPTSRYRTFSVLRSQRACASRGRGLEARGPLF